MQWNKKYRGLLVETICLLYTILFVYTAVSKLINLGVFQWRLERMPYIFPYASLISWGVPFLELVIAGLLWFPKYRTMALYASFILLGLFTSYIIVVLKYSDSIPCSCGGVISTLGWRDHILLNITFMVLSLLGILWSKKKYKMQTHQKTVQ
ncbi:MauE/DoxX family redox-associated membrane protein [Allomuricauda taeanensis]|uniref:MauE/DoxX family redox-associated membrane protein n=1 Tax=Flagellimonas taeanensis TaxID=1005926 RepID=UPI002E7AED6E|nr:MauE/DoxX family redox-associated membrane protein [Allomuricauda taeanensis]MEE1962049.1 MauE/DoxX family redox-associated membrane protein [Allomuricauda taeanensis]